MFFIPPSAGLRGQKRKDLQHDSGQDNSCAHKNMFLNNNDCTGFGLLLFVFLALKGKQIKE